MAPWKKAILPPDAQLVDAIKSLNDSAQHIVMVVDEHMSLLGVLTDGDLRRAILQSCSLQTPIREIMNPQPLHVTPQTTASDVVELMQTKAITRIPIVDNDGYLSGLHSIENMLTSKRHDNTVVIMAGGLGSRLSPLTDATPKPLLKVGGKPILEIIISNCHQHGFSKFYISLNYRGEMIKDYFGDGSRFGVQIQYLEERQQLGTAGALKLMPNMPNLPLLVLNGDLLTNVNLAHLLDFHNNNESNATMGVKQYDVEVPYGVVCTKNETITSLKEKPIHSFMVNAGVYVVNPAVIEQIPQDIKYNMTDLFNYLMSANKKVTAFPIHEYWLDIGKMQDFERAQVDVQKIF